MIRRARSRELYDLHVDPSETKDIAANHPQLVADLETRLDTWAASVPVYSSHVPVKAAMSIKAAPAGDVIEVRIRRDAGESNAFLPVVLATSDLVLSPDDRLEYDMLVADGSPPTGFFVDVIPRARETDPFWWADAVDQHGTWQDASTGFPQAMGRWAHRVVGLANNAPMRFGALRIAFRDKGRGEYVIYLDNLIVRRGDGTIVELYRDGKFARHVKTTVAYPHIKVRSVPLNKVQTNDGEDSRK
jgi:hypothetical protein